MAWNVKRVEALTVFDCDGDPYASDAEFCASMPSKDEPWPSDFFLPPIRGAE